MPTRQIDSEAPRKLTRTATQILSYIERHAGEVCTKADMARDLERNEKTVSRLLTKLRRDGLIEVESSFSENGSQVGNVYRLAPRA